ncbi:hypothetical protein [Bacillus pumilus]|uniref:Uncharacterized protein n=1 Tax=Bacillus pumilus (strain SAFR-032) TaxID=315750 RepID=A8FFY2_BACP2|nr:hypothetical protein [Bacillus pumilus]ABV63149.1 hypothetical protein BPUM_2487 [Bacillus pumilus SAFR-032]MBC3649262.1 hypothetical protein [Bacillus pumilus]MBC3660120.1 hypothetical protein [Bacillus pumilus]MBC3664951.1 hypothetical protein [Bacillus pumilus]MBC3685021.1 hypothetical protein [Bacillus pumilus]
MDFFIQPISLIVLFKSLTFISGGIPTFKINFKKAIGAVALASVLILSAAPAKAETFPGLKWVMEK